MIKIRLSFIYLMLCFINIINSVDISKKRKKNTSSSSEHREYKKAKIQVIDDKVKEIIKKYVQENNLIFFNLEDDIFTNRRDFNNLNQVNLYECINWNPKDILLCEQSAKSTVTNIITEYKINENPIVLALKDNNIEAAKLFIEHCHLEGLIDYFTKHLVGIKKDELESIKLLLELINFSKKDLNTCLIKACNMGYLDLVKLLVETQNLTIPITLDNYIDKYINYRSLTTIDKGHLEVAKYLARKDTSALNQQDSLGFTRLAFSIRNNDFDMVKVLVELGSDLEADSGPGDGSYDDDNDENGIYLTPLMIAAYYRASPEIVKFLITHGADVRTVYREDSLTTLELALENNLDIVNILKIEKSLLHLKDLQIKLNNLDFSLHDKRKVLNQALEKAKENLLEQIYALESEHYEWLICRLLKHGSSNLIQQLELKFPANIAEVLKAYVKLKSNSLYNENQIKDLITKTANLSIEEKNTPLNKSFFNKLLKIYYLKKTTILPVNIISNVFEYLE